MDNPRGEIYGHAAYVVAEEETGRRFQCHVKTARREQEHAESMAEKMADYASDIDFWPNGG